MVPATSFPCVSFSQPRGRARAWHGESVGGGSLRVRPCALGKLSSEIDFAFRQSNHRLTDRTDNPDELTSAHPEPIQSGDYVAALRLRKRGREENLVSTADLRRPPRGRGSQLVPLAESDTMREDRLVWDVNDLRQEIQRLRDHKRALATRHVYRSIATRHAVFKVTNAYFKMFQDGFESGPTAARHEAFLRSVVHRDVLTCSQLVGVDALVEQWRRYAAFFELRDYKLRSVHATAMDDTPILQIACGYHVFITWRTVQYVFPHVVGDPYLVQRVVGKKLECDSRVTFVFDAAGKIVRYDDYSDFVAAFARLLRNARDLDVLMGRALITEHSLIGELEDRPREQRMDACVV